ncbi:VOC family protein [Salmonella enterica subsp. enterica serovar Virchow]|nr:VOC family protein [Salmonella enterica subsp. enterica serovar Java]EBV3599698.1 VOC family protein [Salmonella enterica subsp. enterica serovar Virchow]EBW1603864.1 VOC family protein [Salmonella enterica subsp. enterica serovar Kottbus]EBW2353169.1 VOC family protein [Salmonella enterica subsp. enterica serovar Enteritidis]ECB6741085.1 VOC family protein [Salmonella enterica subsp. enterica serovar Panama]ECF1263627.1 VOC family protein [Salmonella enterica subsp. enterica serovar Uganda
MQVNAVIPYLNIRDAWVALDFYKRAFSTEISNVIERSGHKLAHAEVSIEGARFMMREEYPDYNFTSPTSLGGSPVNLLVFVEDVDAFTTHAAANGATVIRPVEQQFHGDMMSELRDPFGHSWFFATHMVDMTHDELKNEAERVNL